MLELLRTSGLQRLCTAQKLRRRCVTWVRVYMPNAGVITYSSLCHDRFWTGVNFTGRWRSPCRPYGTRSDLHVTQGLPLGLTFSATPGLALCRFYSTGFTRRVILTGPP